MKLEDHPTVRKFRALEQAGAVGGRIPFGAEELKALAMECGAGDVGFIGIDRAELDPQRDEILRHYPWTRSLLSIVVKMAQAPVRGTPRSVANLEFHRAGHETNDVCAGIVARLQDRGIRAVNPSMGFPMEMNQNPGNAIWIVAHKPTASQQAASEEGWRKRRAIRDALPSESRIYRDDAGSLRHASKTPAPALGLGDTSRRQTDNRHPSQGTATENGSQPRRHRHPWPGEQAARR